MTRTTTLMLASIALMTSTIAQAQVVGSTVVGTAAADLREVTLGWSANRQVLGQAVFNDKNERIGAVDDIVIAPTRRSRTPLSGPAASWASAGTMSRYQ